MIDNTNNKGELTCVDNCAPPVVEVINNFISERSSVDGLETIMPDLPKDGKDLENNLSKFSGNVYLRPITYVVTKPLKINPNTNLIGVSGKTRILYTGTGTLLTLRTNDNNISIRDIEFDGGEDVTPKVMSSVEISNVIGKGDKNCIIFDGYAKNVKIDNCEIHGFSGFGIYLSYTNDGVYTRTSKITRCVIRNNYLGLCYNEQAEYHQFYGNSICYNAIGLWIDGGNNFGVNNQCNNNSAGIVLTGTSRMNDTHGSISTTTINHNLSYSLFVLNINNGFTFTGCHFFEGDIYIENSIGLSITGGEVACGIQVVSGRGMSIISNNIFYSSYGGGTVSPNTTLSMNGNRFADGSDSSNINNNL